MTLSNTGSKSIISTDHKDASMFGLLHTTLEALDLEGGSLLAKLKRTVETYTKLLAEDGYIPVWALTTAVDYAIFSFAQSPSRHQQSHRPSAVDVIMALQGTAAGRPLPGHSVFLNDLDEVTSLDILGNGATYSVCK